MNAYLENLNYENDARVRASREKTFIVEDDNGEEHELPTVWAVCPTCNGEGKHTNPSIDCGGLTREDFDEDPDFADEYKAGRYDVTCYGCKGRRVVKVVDESAMTPEQRKLYEDWQEGQREAAAAWDSERQLRAMGG